MHAMIRALVLAALCAAAATAHAGTKRIAVIVGNNAGNPGQAALRYAEADAGKFAQVLEELGNVAPDDLFLLQGKALATVSHAFAVVKQRVENYKRDPANRVVVLFYFSGHSDGEALELGADRLTFADLRSWLASAGADVRVALVDSCKSGALLAIKGGKPGPGFQIRLTDELASTGEVLLTSSAADEVALESREIGGSFFTHHFISGLRGAADASGDGLVTLGEAYQYAYAHTIKTTGETVIGPQHPAYDYRLTGQGELVLSELAKRTATLELPAGFDRVVVIELARDQVVAEVTSDTHVQIAVQPGRYALHAARSGQGFAGEVSVAVGGQRVVAASELAPSATITTASKGATEPVFEVDAGAPRVFATTGGGLGVGKDVGVAPGLRVEAVSRDGWTLAVQAFSSHPSGYRESEALALAGYRRGWRYGRWLLWTGVDVGGGMIIQSALSAIGFSGVLAGELATGAEYHLTSRIAYELALTAPLEVLDRDGHYTALLLPAGWLGFSFGL